MRNEKRIGFGPALCICPKCGHSVKRSARGLPCSEQKCPHCGATMSGELCLENGDVASVRMMKFECCDCGLLMLLSKKPESCVKCGGLDIIRHGWRMPRQETIRIIER